MVSVYQAFIIASKLKEAGFRDARDIPLRIWLSLGFLVQPTAAFRVKVTEIMTRAEEGQP
jgi:hypothetical protein